jgi:leucyl aminopeptidase
MELKLIAQDLTQTSKTACDALIVLVPESFAKSKLDTKAISKAKPTENLTDLISQALKEGDFETKTGKLLQIYRSNHTSATRTVLVGAGDGSVKSIKTAVTAAVSAIKSTSSKKLVICLSELTTANQEVAKEAVKASVLCAADASYVYTSTKTKMEPRKLTSITVAVDKDALSATDLIASQAYITPAMTGIEFAKEWGNRPANHATPDLLGKAAKSLSKYKNISVDVLGLKEVTKLGMGSFISVAQGSDQPLRFIVLKYNGAAKTVAPTVLVGKGITFDTGGISLKPAPEMDEMKFDMCGAASVLGTFRALAGIQPKINVVGLIPACENMPSGKAVKPGDVVTSMSGQTIENLNTDAEGRLVLCDALTYAERFKPAAVIDIATLTGACVIALGAVRSGLFSANDDLANALLKAGESSGDPCWRMPLDDEYGEGLKSNFADMANVAGRAAGSVTAAKFLQKFTASYPWAHLDIAGTAWKSGAVKGSTGRPVLLLLNYLLNLESNQAVAGVSIASVATKKIVKTSTKVAAKSTKSAVKA